MMGFSAESLVPIIQRLGEDIRGAEIGVCRGENIHNLLNACQNISLIIGIDPWKAYKDKLDISQEVAEAWMLSAHDLLGMNCRAVLIRGESLDAAKFIAPGFLDFAFIDGNHTYEAALADMRDWWMKVRPGGLLCGHDYREKDVEVRKAVTYFSKEIKQEPEDTGTCWYFRK